MAPMRQQSITNEFRTGEAMRLMNALSAASCRMSPVAGEVAARQAVLRRTVQDEVIPRLLMARRPAAMPVVTEAPGRPGAEAVERLVTMVLNDGPAEAHVYVEAMHVGGTPIESLFLDLLSPTARRLGEMWEDDICNFTDVTMGLQRLGNVLRLLGRAFTGDYDASRSGPSALLVQMPGEQHGFGLAMVVQFFRHAGWNVRQEPVLTSADLIGIVQRDWFGIVGISVACSDRTEALANDIRAIRRHSRNRSVGIMVGGPPFMAHPQLAALVGADATATDGRQAVHQARSLISLLAQG